MCYPRDEFAGAALHAVQTPYLLQENQDLIFNLDNLGLAVSL